MVSAHRIPVVPTDIIGCSSDLSDLRLKTSEKRRAAVAAESKNLKQNTRYGTGRVIGRADTAAVLAKWKDPTPASPTDVTAWVVSSGMNNPFIMDG